NREQSGVESEGFGETSSRLPWGWTPRYFGSARHEPKRGPSVIAILRRMFAQIKVVPRDNSLRP
ncbi:MAG: hypothetical protein M1499_02790, partial [Firmicutes bacterium]|nr:hypothetical protein [Bacillota bacterium]